MHGERAQILTYLQPREKSPANLPSTPIRLAARGQMLGCVKQNMLLEATVRRMNKYMQENRIQNVAIEGYALLRPICGWVLVTRDFQIVAVILYAKISTSVSLKAIQRRKQVKNLGASRKLLYRP